MNRIMLALLVTGWTAAAVAAPSGMKVGVKAPGFSCPAIGENGKPGENVALRDLLAQGNVVVMSFFHTTCKPCIKEIPKLTEVVKARAGKPLAAYLVFVGTEDDETVTKFLKQYGFTLPVLMDRHGLRVGEPYKVVKDDIAHVPQIMVISKNGVLKAAWTGFPDGQEVKLGALLDELIAEEKQVVQADTLTILFTNNANGLTGPSPAIDVGGLARRATVIKRERAAAPASILVDAGDFLPTSPEETRSGRVVAAYAAMKYDAMTIGEAEFVNGLKFLRGVTDAKTLPLVSANVKICEDETCVDLVRPHAVVPAGKRKVAIYGYMHPDALGFTPEERMKDGKWYFKITDPRPPLKGFMSRFRKEADLVVVLSHAGIEEDRKLAAEVPGIDVIVGAHSQTFLADPARENGALIVQAAADGQYVGKLVLKFNDGGKPGIESHELIPLTKNIVPDPEVAAIVAGKQLPKAEAPQP